MSYDLNAQFDQTFGLPSYGNLAAPGMSQAVSRASAMGFDPLSSVNIPTGAGLGALPSIGQSGGFLKGFGADDARLVLGGLQTIGNLWGAWQSMKLAKEQFKFTKDVTNTNLNNQIKSYNTALGDRSRSRAAVESQSAAQAQAYVDQNKLSRSGG